MSRAIVPSAPAANTVRFGGGLAPDVMSPSMIASIIDFNLFEEVQASKRGALQLEQRQFGTMSRVASADDITRNAAGSAPAAAHLGTGGGRRDGVELPGSAAADRLVKDEYDAELGEGGGGGSVGGVGGMVPNNKILPLPPKIGTTTNGSESAKSRLASLRKRVENPQKSCFSVMTPNNKFFKFWDPVLIVCLIFTAVVTPVEVAFLRQPQWPFDRLFYVNRVVDACFFLDMLLQFNMAYNSSSHMTIIITDRWKIAKRYLRGSFIIDFISILPYDSLPGGVSELKALRTARLLKLFKLLRVLRAGRIFNRLETTVVINYALVKLTRFFFMVVFSAHLMACAFRLVVGIEDNLESNWILNYFGDESYAKYDDPPWATLYMTAYYWSIMTMTTIGYGDVLPVTIPEMVCTTICMMIGTSIYAYIFGNICSILDEMTIRSQLFHSTMDQLNTFMEARGLPEKLRVRLREFYRYKFDHRGMEDWHSLISDMSPLLQGEVAVQINGTWLQSIPLLRDCDDKLYTQISLAMASVAYCPLESVVDLHEPPTAMYIVERGVVGGMSRIFTGGSCLGQDCLWQPLDSPRSYAASTLSFATLLTLQRSDVMEVVAFFPEVRKRLVRAGVRARAQRKIVVYARAIHHFRHALKQYTWTCPTTGKVLRGMMMLPREGMTKAMDFILNFPPERDIDRVDSLFSIALEGVVQACWGRWVTYQEAASKIQSCFRGSKQRTNFVSAYAVMISAAETLQRGARKMLFKKRLAGAVRLRRSFGDLNDPNTDVRFRLMHVEDRLGKLDAAVREVRTRSQQESQFIIGMLAEVHAAVHMESQANKMAMQRRTLKPSKGNDMMKFRRGFKGF